jgi:hypothetical protein
MRFERFGVGALVLAGSLAASRAGVACPCRGSAGPAAPLTAPFEVLGGNVTELAELAHGSWNASGDYTPLSDDERRSRLHLLLALGVRPVEPLELSAQLGYGRSSVSSKDFQSSHTGFGDTMLGARFLLLEEPMGHVGGFPWPAVTAILAARAPTGSLTDDGAPGSGSLGSSGSSDALGTWEAGGGVEARRRLTDSWELVVLGEAAYRFSDDALGLERQLGPRLLGYASVSYDVDELSLGALTSLEWEGEVAFDDRTRSGTAQRLLSAGAFVSWLLREPGLRGGVLLRTAPPLDAINANVFGATTFGLSLGWSG